MNYHYPIDENWTTEEVIDVVNFFTLIEQAYEKQVKRDDILIAYNGFKQVVPSKSEEKQMFRQFERASNYACYPVVRRARETTEQTIQMKQ